MSKAIKLRVLIDYVEDDVFRDIEIMSMHTFETLHKSIQDAFGFDNQHMASFYMSSDNWEKGQEITLMDMTEGDTPIMANTPLDEYIDEPGQKLLYVFDFMLMWCFFVEVVSIGPVNANTIYPKVIVTHGVAPDQYSKEPPMMGGDDFAAGMPDDDPNESGNVMDVDSLFTDLDDPTRFN